MLLIHVTNMLSALYFSHVFSISTVNIWDVELSRWNLNCVFSTVFSMFALIRASNILWYALEELHHSSFLLIIFLFLRKYIGEIHQKFPLCVVMKWFSFQFDGNMIFVLKFLHIFHFNVECKILEKLSLNK